MDSAGEMRGEESQILIWNHVFGFVNSLVLKCAIELSIVDTIHHHGKPITLRELGSSLTVPPSNLSILHRIMRYLANMQIVVIINNQQITNAEYHDVAYVLAPAAELLLKGERSLAPYIMLSLPRRNRETPLDTLKTSIYEETSPDDSVKKELWAQASRDTEFNKFFNEAMASRAALLAARVAEACPATFEGINTLVDVGGGTGTVAQGIVGVYPHIRCTVLDLPHVVEGVPKCRGVDFVGGDMFDFVPHADGVILTCLLHGWNDEKCLQILRKCKEAIPKTGGKLIIVDCVIPDTDQEEDEFYSTKLAVDMFMLINGMGKERTEKEWKELLARAGFIGCKITSIRTPQNVIEAHT